MKPPMDDALRSAPHYEDPITFLVRFFQSSPAEVLATLDLYAISADALVLHVTSNRSGSNIRSGPKGTRLNNIDLAFVS